MNISTDHQDENPFPNKPSGGYEWWYFDALSSDGKWGFVIIFYQGNPFSPEYIQQMAKSSATADEFPAVSISIYNKEKTEFYSFVEYSESEFEWDEDTSTCRTGPHSFKKSVIESELTYSLQLDDILPSGHSIKAALEFKNTVMSNDLLTEKKSETHHFWNLIQPKAQVKGEIELEGKSGTQTISFNGTGYHDHNVGIEPMKDDFKDWYWGRFHFEGSTLIYYVMNRNNEKQYTAWLIADNNEDLVQLEQVELDSSLKSLFGLKSARKIVLKSDDSEITIQSAIPIDNGPFYQRFLSKAIMNRNGKISVSDGISEYIYPENIYAKKFWPAVRMRLRFDRKKPHWVQKFKMFYEWTW